MDDDFEFEFEADIETKDALRKASLKADGIEKSSETALSTTKGRHSLVCKHYLEGLCMKGDRCDFLHHLDPDKMPECTMWLKFGKCTDPNCLLRHVANVDRPECTRFKLGFCRYGVLCRSRHDRLPRAALPDILPDWFLSSMIVNAYLIPRTDDLPVAELREKLRHGSGVKGNHTKEVPEPTRPLTATATKTLLDQGTIPALPPPVNGKCRFFVIRSMNVRNVQISAAKGIWASSGRNVQKFKQSLRAVDHVIVIFMSSESRSFFGYGKMVSEPDESLLPGIWGEMSSRLSPNFKVHWLKQCDLPIRQADHIKYVDDEELPVGRCRDGQELPASVGERLCRLLWQQNEVDLVKGSDFEFEPRVSYEHLAKGGALALENGTQDEPPPRPKSPEGKRRAPSPEAPRPAPERLGTFDADKARNNRPRVQALASGSSSLAQALREETTAPPHGYPPAWGSWTPPPHGGWRPPPMHPHHAAAAAAAAWRYYPPPGYYPPHGYPPPAYPGYYPPPAHPSAPLQYPGASAPPPPGAAAAAAPAAATAAAAAAAPEAGAIGGRQLEAPPPGFFGPKRRRRHHRSRSRSRSR